MSVKTSICLYRDHACDLPASIKFAERNGCDVIITSITHPLFYRETEDTDISERHIQFTRSDLILEPVEWLNKIVAKLSNYVDCDSSDVSIRKQGERILRQEIALAQHLSSHGYMLINLKNTNTLNLARIITAEIQGK